MGIERVLVCDGHNIVYRSYFAIKNLATDAGVPTNALFGFIRQIEALKSRTDPSHLAVVFDAGIPARRMELLESYKAQRPRMPDELRSQMEPIEEYLRRARIVALAVEGEEADDVMATIARRVERDADADVLLASSDKDLMQLVAARTLMCPPSGKGGLLGCAEVVDKTGVRPEQIVDWLAMVGDSADNIPGVRGIGPKTAAKLMKQFGSMEELYARIADVKPEGVRAKLEEGRGIVDRNRKLMRLDEDVELDVDLNEMKIREPDEDALLDFFEEYEFRGLARNLREPELF